MKGRSDSTIAARTIREAALAREILPSTPNQICAGAGASRLAYASLATHSALSLLR